MKLLHHTEVPFVFDPSRKYRQSFDQFKPEGLWFSVDGEHSWREWCEGEGFNLDRLKHTAEIFLKPDAKVLRITNSAELVEFDHRYSDKNYLNLRGLRWSEVAFAHDGVIIAPYNWQYRLQLMWYYGWDCASGVVWNLDAVERVEAR